MERDARHESGRGCALGISVGVVLLPILYFLSIGPAGLAHQHGLISQSALVIYAPLEWIAERNESFMAFGQWYCGLWGLGS